MITQISEALNALKSKLAGWLDSAIIMLPNFVIALIVIVSFFLIGRYGKKIGTKLLNKVSANTAINRLLASTFFLILFSIGIFVALGVLNLDKTVTSILAGAGILGLAVGLAFQDTISNSIAGIIMAVRKPYKIGDIIETNDYFGTIKHIGLRQTFLNLYPGQIVIIPNKDVLGNAVVNYSLTGKRRVDISCGVSYGDSLEQVEDIAKEAVRSNISLMEDTDVELFYTEFGDSSINFVLRFWTTDPNKRNYLDLQSKAIKAIKRAFDANDITIPFPIRTLDFGIKGGDHLKNIIRPETLSVHTNNN